MHEDSRGHNAKVPFQVTWNGTFDYCLQLRLLQISQCVILNRVKDLFSVLLKQILRSAQDDGIMETDFCRMLNLLMDSGWNPIIIKFIPLP